MGLNSASKKYGHATKGLNYVKSRLWWLGMVFMAIGEFANFAAYSFAPAILVTPLGALSVIVGAVLASVFLGERIDSVGKSGCALCLLGALQVVMNSPEDPEINSVVQIMSYVKQPLFMSYAITCGIIVFVFITIMVPKYGARTPLVYLTICSLGGSFTVVACKALGIAVKLTIQGSNQLKYLSTYLFLLSVLGCIALQLNYFNKALASFNTNVVTPIYYVMFTTLTIVANMILFNGFSGSPDAFVSILSGFFTLFIGVYLLNHSKDQTGSEFAPVERLSSNSSFDLQELGLPSNYPKSLSSTQDSSDFITNDGYQQVLYDHDDISYYTEPKLHSAVSITSDVESFPVTTRDSVDNERLFVFNNPNKDGSSSSSAAHSPENSVTTTLNSSF
ncbi:putative magnesium transporter NIPA4 [Smittium mucronatum]|uniref:Putative magnesium transporter NIPA4 n=1 Tax=Smittium mucronatum TaxID=133383 RepID=A0A1R0H0C4_9FUNG|nr:putative magnesium transporter NIPA4 [Smittium mucronatum]